MSETRETWIILGASSSMAGPFIRTLAEAGHGLILAGRDKPDLAAIAADAGARGASHVAQFALDVRDAASFRAILTHAEGCEGQLCCAVFVGSMPDQSQIDAEPGLVSGVVTDSFSGPARFLQALAPMLESRGGGSIVGVGSVAGDRGRLGNYVYGAAKAGFATYLSGLRNRLGREGVHVMTVKPGPVDTAMTWGLGPQPFMTTPDTVARDILKGLRKGRNVVYTAGIWRWVMLVIRMIPEPIFKKMSI
ncbi:SDR family NAD(P)-dependent oxidoreductase [Rhodobacteraceae bacterium 63075]|nr:SDR family NAD(P)-dependent oxidoreductase [Rhodobacteraceae bacterium 63075]